MGEKAEIGKAFDVLGLESRDLADLTRVVGEVGSKKFSLAVADASSSKVVQIVDQPVKLGVEAHLELTAELVAPPAAADIPDAFGDPFALNGPLGTRPGLFTFAGRLGAEAGLSAPIGGIGVASAAAVAGANCEFRQVTPVFISDSVATALTKCIATSRLPGPGFGLKLAPGQSRSFRGHLSLGLDAKISAGKSWTREHVLGLFAGLPHLTVAAEAAVSAALGFGLDEEMAFAAGKGPLSTSPVRLRLSRSSTRELTFGATIAVRVETNAGTVLVSLLDHIFDLDPVAETLNVFQQVAALKDPGGWKKLAETLADSGAERFVELVEDEHWIGWGDERIRAFIDHAKRVVAAWRQLQDLDGRLRSWLDTQLAAVGLAAGSKARTVLGRLANLDPDPEALGATIAEAIRKGGSTELLTLLELVTGRSLEQLLSHPLSEIAPLVSRAVAAAKQAEALLNGLGDPQLDLIGRYAANSGIVDVVAWLEDNATSVPALQGAMSKAVRKVVSRLVDRAWEKLDDADLHRIQDFARRIAAELEKLEEWRKNVTADFKRIDQGLGFRLGIEISRVTTEEAVLDLEIAESDPAFGEIAREFGWGRIAKVMSLVGDVFEKGGDEVARDIVVRECALVSRFVRASALTSLLQAFGIDWLSTRKAQRFYQRAVTVSKGGLQRKVHHSAGARVSEMGKDGVFAAGIELGFGAEGALGLEKPYTKILDSELRLTVQVEDSRIEPEELAALDALLAETGFTGPDSVAMALQSGQTALKFALELSFKGPLSRITELIEKASTNEEDWTAVVMRAGSRWFSDQLVTASEASIEGVRIGDVVTALFSDKEFAAGLAKGSNEAEKVMKAKKNVMVGQQQVSILTSDGLEAHRSLTDLVHGIPSVRKSSRKEVRKFVDRPIVAGESPVEVLSAVQAFALFAISMTPNDTIRNPMFGFWVLWNIFSNQDLKQRGIATCRFSEAKKESPWTEPFVWTA